MTDILRRLAAAGLILIAAGPARGQEELPDPKPAAKPAAKAPSGLRLNDAIRAALARSPNIAAYKASLDSAKTSVVALGGVSGLTKLLAPDIEYRQRQALKGVAAAQAQLNQARADLVYEVTRSYYSVAYAKAQFALADDALKQVTDTTDKVDQALKDGSGSKNLNADTLDKLKILVGLAGGRRVEAQVGIRRAEAALREALALPVDYPLDVPVAAFRFAEYVPAKGQVIAHALSRRGELIQAGLAADIFHLEVCAQLKITLRPLARTFAAGADIHSRQIPPGSRGANYRPYAIGVEMPTSLFGEPEERAAKAKALARRADAVYHKVGNLIRLEAENAYHRLDQARRVFRAQQSSIDAIDSLEGRDKDRDRARQLENLQDALFTRVLTGQTRAAYNQTLFDYLVAMADIERITAGGLYPPLPNR